jgi:DNA-binding response OmpR family regulator
MDSGVERPCQVLMIDDDKDLCNLIRDYLGTYGMTVRCALDGNSGLTQALNAPCDAVLLDMMLPGLSGLEVLKRIRAKKPQLPVVVISAQTDVNDRIVGLEMGADDYVPKTFAPRELLARLHAVIRRAHPPTPAAGGGVWDGQGIVVVHGLRLDPCRMEVTLDGRPLAVSTIEFRLLYLLASQPGRVFSRERLMEEISGREYGGLDRSIDMHISALRRKLDDSPRSPSYLRTVRGSGYMFMK